jgi:4-hydroxy-3-polyprenylbenzoate decarboxylase
MPENVDEYLLAGFLRKKPVKLVKCLTNDLYIPEDADFVIEGYVDPAEEFIWEGPFGDHTGFYSLADWYPKFHVTCITHRKDAVYPATIVGVPPMEDAWIGKATERIFLTPIRLAMLPELKDIDLPFAGVAHNLTIVKIHKTYPGQAVKVMHSLWGAGQMMFNKILVVVDEYINIHDYKSFAKEFVRNFNAGYSLHFSKGPLDILDHSSQKFAFGSKLGIDLTSPLPEEIQDELSENQESFDFKLIETIKPIVEYNVKPQELPVLLLGIEKENTFDKKSLITTLKQLPGISVFKIIILFNSGADLQDLFMLVWLTGGNLEPERDISITLTAENKKIVFIDCTIKTEINDGFKRDWPNVVVMDETTISNIDRKWASLGLGDFINSPSRKFMRLNKGFGAVRQ